MKQKYHMFRMFVFLCAALYAGLFTMPAQASKLSGEGAAYKRDLIKAIDLADRTVVTEHSNQFDFFDYKIRDIIEHEEITYQTVTLSEQDKIKFRQMIKAVPNKMPDAIALCIFDPHHTVSFFDGDKLVSRLDICFVCGAEKWNGTKYSPPQNFNAGLRKFIKEIGLSPDRNWKRLAMEQLEKDAAQSTQN